jgi:hypothetical protein
MKTLFQNILKLASLSLLLLVGATATAQAQGARVQMSQLEYLSGKASETVDVNIDEKLMQLTAKFFSSKDEDEKAVKEIISGLKGIFVKSFEFEHEGEYSDADVESVRSQLRGPEWTKIVAYASKKDGKVEVYLQTNGAQIGGLAVLATEPKELTVVNIVGPVDIDKLSKLEGQFGVPVLDIDQPSKPKKN